MAMLTRYFLEASHWPLPTWDHFIHSFLLSPSKPVSVNGSQVIFNELIPRAAISILEPHEHVKKALGKENVSLSQCL